MTSLLTFLLHMFSFGICVDAYDENMDLSDEYLSSCIELVSISLLYGEDPYLIMGIAHRETRFKKGQRSPHGAYGLIQVKPLYWCKDINKCDYILAGIRALNAFKNPCVKYNIANECLKRGKRTLENALCHYNCGNKCFRSGKHYASQVLKSRDRFSGRRYD